jgi:DNA-binding transcriptional MerR regulator
VTTYNRKELARAAKVSRFFIGHSVTAGLIPAADGEGPGRHYTDRHLHHLVAVRNLRDQGLRADELRQRMTDASEDEIRELAGVARPALPPAVRSRASLRYGVNAVVSAAADALDVSPKRVRPAIVAALAAMREEKISVDEAASILEESSAP